MTHTSVQKVDLGAGAVAVVVDGDLDMASAELVAATVAGAVHRAGTRSVAVDLAGVLFLDSSGMRVLVAARKVADESGVRLQVVNLNNVVRQTLYVMGVLEWLTGSPWAPSPASG